MRAHTHTRTLNSECVLSGAETIAKTRSAMLRPSKNNLRSFIRSCPLFCFYRPAPLPKAVSQGWCERGRPDCCASVRRSQSLSMRRSTDLRNSINASAWWVLRDWHGDQRRHRLSCALTSPHPTEKLTVAP